MDGFRKVLRVSVCLVVTGLALPAVGVPAQEPKRASEPQATIRAEVALVNVVFTVTDRAGKAVTGLTVDDFLVFEDRRPQKIEYYSEFAEASEVPLTIGLLMDTSGSVKRKLEYEKHAAAEFFDSVLRRNKDLGMLMRFDSEVQLVQDFTEDPDRLIAALDDLKAGNSTALYDAIWLAVEQLKREVGRRVIVVITDGDDTSSRVRKEEAIEAAQMADVLIYGIGVRGDFGANFSVLKKFAEETGGAFFSPKARQSEIETTFRTIGQDLKNQYSLAYVSTNAKKDGTFRAIDIKPKKPGLRVRTRRGYYAPRERPVVP
jgi:Ca-activated chloride channel homolog